MEQNEDILRNVGKQTVLITTDFHSTDKTHQDIIQNTFFNVSQKKVSHSLDFWVNYHFKISQADFWDNVNG